jgi:serine/threonine protein kinase
MVTELLGPSLFDLRKFIGTKFTIQTTLMIAIEALKLVQHIHDKGMLHRDMKPSNFCMGQGAKQDQVYLIDYGLAKKFTFD